MVTVIQEEGFLTPFARGLQSLGVQRQQQKLQEALLGRQQQNQLSLLERKAQLDLENERQKLGIQEAQFRSILGLPQPSGTIESPGEFVADSGLSGAPGREIDEVVPADRSRTTVQDLTEQQLSSLQAHPNQMVRNAAKAEFENRKFQRAKFNEDRKFAGEVARPFLKDIDQSRDAVRSKENAADLMDNAIESQDFGFFSADNWANFTGVEAFRTAKGAQLLLSQKEYLLGNIRRAGARPNQWIEQQIASMLPQIGRSREANESTAAALKAETSIERKKIEIADEIAERERERLGYVPENIGAQVDAALQPYAEEINNQLSYKLRQIHERESGAEKLTKLKKVPKGTPLTLEMAGVLRDKFGSNEKVLENAKKMGFTIPTKDQFERWTQ